jgi:hypothetical protein
MKKIDQLISFADNFLKKNLGDDPQWSRINGALWKVIRDRTDHVFPLSEINTIVEDHSCCADDILAVLGLLASNECGRLRMELRDGAISGPLVPLSMFTEKLTGWWRNKSISEQEWADWASSIKVRWVPVPLMENCQ